MVEDHYVAGKNESAFGPVVVSHEAPAGPVSDIEVTGDDDTHFGR